MLEATTKEERIALLLAEHAYVCAHVRINIWKHSRSREFNQFPKRLPKLNSNCEEIKLIASSGICEEFETPGGIYSTPKDSVKHCGIITEIAQNRFNNQPCCTTVGEKLGPIPEIKNSFKL